MDVIAGCCVAGHLLPCDDANRPLKMIQDCLGKDPSACVEKVPMSFPSSMGTGEFLSGESQPSLDVGSDYTAAFFGNKVEKVYTTCEDLPSALIVTLF